MDATAIPARPDSRATTAIVAALASCMLLASLGTSLANVLLPALATRFAASMAAAQSVVLSYLVALTVALVGAGRLGDRYGRRRLLLASLGVFALASAACVAAPTLGVVVAARAVQGLGAAGMMALAMALLRDATPAARLGSAMGVLATASAIGTALGPSLGGIVAAMAGWRAAFGILVPTGAAVLALAAWALPADPAREAPPARSAGIAWMRDLPRRNFMANALVSMVMMATLVVGPFYLAQGLGLGSASIGLVLSAGPVMSIACGVPAGRAVDRFGAARAMVAGLLALFAGSLALAWLPAALGVGGYVASLLLLTPGYQLFQAANNTATLARVPANRRGGVSGLLTLSRNVGLLAGASLMGLLYAIGTRIAQGTPSESASSGLRATFLAGAVLVAIALASTLPRRDRR